MPTKIEWATETWNPVTGCTKVSPGCAHCYAERMAQRLAGRAGYPADEPFRVTFHPDQLDKPFHWRKPRLIFVCSMGDLFHEDVQVAWFAQVMDAMSAADRHFFLFLTKRPQEVMPMLDAAADWTADHMPESSWLGCMEHRARRGRLLPENVGMGVTAENQATAEERIPLLMQIPAAMRFVSCEPLLDEVSLEDACAGETDLPDHLGLDWVLTGCESGPGRRNTKIEWVRSLVDICAFYDVPCLVKQIELHGKVSHDPTEWPEDLRVRQFPPAVAGILLPNGKGL